MSFSNEINRIRLGAMGSEIATLVGRYRRESKQKMSLSEEDKNILVNAITFVENMGKGYTAVVETHNFNINSDVPVSYNYYIKVRQQLPELGPVNQASEIEREIEMFADVLKKLSEEKPLAEKEGHELDKVGKFFSRLSDFALEELYIINNEKRELESL